MKETDVVIIGAGPAGSVCGNLLKEAGVDCVLVDFQKFPRDKVCGGGLTPKAWHLLEEMMPDLKYAYNPIRQVRTLIDGKEVLAAELSEELRIVKRKDFDHMLLQRYLQKDGTFIQDAFSLFEELEDQRILVTLQSGAQLKCRYLVAADGANSRVRHQMFGLYHAKILCIEQYMEKTSNVLEVEISSRFDHGYYYKFPQEDCDVVGYGDRRTSKDGFRQLLAEKGFAENKLLGANIPVEVVESDRDHIILIGDAGGFANKLTYEGLYYAMVTGRNASVAITKGISFREANRIIFQKKRRQRWITELFYSPVGRGIVRVCGLSPRIVRWIYDRKIARRRD